MYRNMSEGKSFHSFRPASHELRSDDAKLIILIPDAEPGAGTFNRKNVRIASVLLELHTVTNRCIVVRTHLE